MSAKPIRPPGLSKKNGYGVSRVSSVVGFVTKPTILQGGVPAGTWVPTPPSSYSSSGTVTKQVTVDSTLSTNFVTWTASRQHIVKTSTGVLFIAYSYAGDGSHNNEKWRLKRSDDDGSTWSLVTDSNTAGYPINGGGAPGVEIDENDNLYVIVSQYRSTSPNVIFRIFKYTAADDYASPTSISTTLDAANKWGCYWDQSRGWLWMQAWERGFGDNSTDLMAVDGNGVVKVNKKIFGPFDHNVGTTRNADVSYPVLTGLRDGTIIVAWHNEAGSGYIPTFDSGTQSYYDVEFVYTPDGGSTFIGPNGTIVGTVIGDDSAPSNRAAYRVVDQSDWTTASNPEFIPASDSQYLANGGTRYNVNQLDALAFNHNALHFFYWAFSTAAIVGPSHRHHTRFDWASKAVDLRTRPFATTTGTALTMSASSGNFVQDTSQSSRLYFVGISSNSPAVIYSDDGGSSWLRYAVGTSITSPVYTNACRWVQSDGKILASTQSGSSVIFIEVTPA